MKLLQPPKIALAGPTGGGKTWFIDELGRKLDQSLQTVRIKKDTPALTTIAFADPIYEVQYAMFGGQGSTMNPRQFNEWLKAKGLDNSINPVVGRSPRGFRQQFGTEFCRSANAEVFSEMMAAKLEVAKQSPSTGVIVLDLRFPDELYLLQGEGFEIMFINTMQKHETSHKSESHMGLMEKHADHSIQTMADASMAVDLTHEMFHNYIETNYHDSGIVTL